METLIKQLKAIIDSELPLISNLSNAAALLNTINNINWCGFYLNDGEKLILGPFQGEVACTVIPYGKGVCGTAFETKSTIIVEDVNEFKGHIACSSVSKSEIVVPIIVNNSVKAVIDIDAPVFNRFNQKDAVLLETFAKELEVLFDE